MRNQEDRRDGWGPHCVAHQDISRTVIQLDSSLYWIKILCGGIFALALTAASIGLPMIYSMNKSVSSVLENHEVRITKLEGWRETRESIYPTGRDRR